MAELAAGHGERPLAGSRPGDVARWVEILARVGYAAKGVVYVAVGILAVAAAVRGGTAEGSSGAISELARQPFGAVILVIVAAGLVGYVVWRVVQAFADPEGKGTDAKGLVVRASLLISGIVYGLLAVEAIRILTGNGGGNGGGSGASHWTAELMSQPFGQWLVGLVAVIIVIRGGVEIHRAFTEKYKKRLAMGSIDPDVKPWVERSGKLGLTARGVTFGIIGFFLGVAAIQAQPGEARGLAGALEALQQQPYGPWILGVVGVGLAAYGAFQFVKARYRRFG